MDSAAIAARLEQELLAEHGSAQAERIRRGVAQLVSRWRPSDGDAQELTRFAHEHFVSDPVALHDTAQRLEYAMEMLDGHANEVDRELSRFQDLDEGAERPVDALLAAYSPDAHIGEDLYSSKIAFVVLLNFPLTTLGDRLGSGRSWSRETWALGRLADRFEFRVPASVLQEIARASSEAEGYINGYDIRMDHLVAPGGGKPFPDGLRLVSHWGLRDEIRAQYGQPGGLERQRLIAKVMDRIIRQQIPAAAVASATVDWDPERNLVRRGTGAWEAAEREPDRRYAELLGVFRAMRQADPYYPRLSSYLGRVFERDREIPEARVRELLESVLGSPIAKRVAERVRQRLGRPLEPFDLWYPGFRPAAAVDEAALDRLTRQRYPDVKSFQRDIPRILGELGFATDTAAYVADHIVVDPARGPGHAAGAKRRDDKAHLRTRVAKTGMDYKGFNIAVHELGHNVEQVFSMSRIDHTLLEGVPNNGFTEAFAFLFQARDRQLLGQATADPQAEALRTLDRFWSTFEIAGVGLLDIETWHWMYQHPQATPAELREAVTQLGTGIWNRYYAPVLGVSDSALPAIYSHIIAFGLYTPDYALGYLITFQIDRYLEGKNLGAEMERMCRLGRLAPDVWMQQAVGSDLSSRPLLEATEAALSR